MKLDGGSAFPCSWDEYPRGMTLRDYFAAAALQGIMASAHFSDDWNPIARADSAYKLADAMIAEMNK